MMPAEKPAMAQAPRQWRTQAGDSVFHSGFAVIDSQTYRAQPKNAAVQTGKLAAARVAAVRCYGMFSSPVVTRCSTFWPLRCRGVPHLTQTPVETACWNE